MGGEGRSGEGMGGEGKEKGTGGPGEGTGKGKGEQKWEGREGNSDPRGRGAEERGGERRGARWGRGNENNPPPFYEILDPPLCTFT